jgi:primase-polymerase (primpol)-like protein
MTAIDRFAIPGDLASRRQWVVWRLEQRDGKPTKVPYRARVSRNRASSTDPATWATFEAAVGVVESGKADGLGFVFSEVDPFTGVDLDGCRDPESGDLNPVAAAIVDELNSYSEISPSQTGVHVIVRGQLRGSRNRRGPVEIYDAGRYFCMTGRRLEGMPHSPMPRQRELDALVARLFPPPAASADPVSAARSVPADDRELLERAFSAKNGGEVERLFRGDTSGYGSHSEADLALVAHLAYWTSDDPARIDALFRQSGLYREKWERPDYRERTIGKALGRG